MFLALLFVRVCCENFEGVLKEEVTTCVLVCVQRTLSLW